MTSDLTFKLDIIPKILIQFKTGGNKNFKIFR